MPPNMSVSNSKKQSSVQKLPALLKIQQDLNALSIEILNLHSDIDTHYNGIQVAHSTLESKIYDISNLLEQINKCSTKALNVKQTDLNLIKEELITIKEKAKYYAKRINKLGDLTSQSSLLAQTIPLITNVNSDGVSSKNALQSCKDSITNIRTQFFVNKCKITELNILSRMTESLHRNVKKMHDSVIKSAKDMLPTTRKRPNVVPPRLLPKLPLKPLPQIANPQKLANVEAESAFLSETSIIELELSKSEFLNLQNQLQQVVFPSPTLLFSNLKSAFFDDKRGNIPTAAQRLN